MFTRLKRLWASDGGIERAYLDYAAATPIRREVQDAMAPYWRERFANPSAIHKEGQEAARAVADARMSVARLLGIRSGEVTFVSGGTEANNLALFGVVEAALRKREPENIHVISTKVEHPSILEALAVLAARGVRVTYIPVSQEGKIDHEALRAALTPETLLVTFAYVNSEVGVVQDVKRIGRAVRAYREERGSATPYVHLDASQAPLWLSCRISSLGADLMTLDAGKCYGPKGIGVLAHRRQVSLLPHLFGGDQESRLRAGTENVPLIVGCAKALQIAQDGWKERAARVMMLRDYMIERLTGEIGGALLNGSSKDRVANNVNVSIEGIDGEFAVVTLDRKGVAASTRSACETLRSDGIASRGKGSHVVRALGFAERAESTVRFSFGEETTVDEIDRAVEILAEHVRRTRKDSPVPRPENID